MVEGNCRVQPEDMILGSSSQWFPLEGVTIGCMASGHTYLGLSSRVSWESFPRFADELLRLIGGERLTVVDAPDMRIWTISAGGVRLRLVYDDYPQGVTLESDSAEGDEKLKSLKMRLAAT